MNKQWNSRKTFCFLETWMLKRGSNPRSFQAGSFTRGTRASALSDLQQLMESKSMSLRAHPLLPVATADLTGTCMWNWLKFPFYSCCLWNGPCNGSRKVCWLPPVHRVWHSVGVRWKREEENMGSIDCISWRHWSFWGEGSLIERFVFLMYDRRSYVDDINAVVQRQNPKPCFRVHTMFYWW